MLRMDGCYPMHHFFPVGMDCDTGRPALRTTRGFSEGVGEPGVLQNENFQQSLQEYP